MAKVRGPRLRRIAHAVLIGLVLAVMIKANSDPKCSSMLCQGDFPAFYSAAVLASQKNWEGLSNQELHAKIQREIWPDLENGFYLSAYPPFFSYLLQPLAGFEPHTAKIVFTALNLFAMLLSVAILAAFNPRTKAYRYELCAFTLLWYPILVGAFSGQLSGFNMLLFSMGLSQLFQSDFKAKFLAGIFFGLWLIKPQFSFVSTLILLGMGELVTISGIALIGLGYYLLGATIQGLGWPLTWYQGASKFHDLDITGNGFQMISLDGALQQLFGNAVSFSTLEVFAFVLSLSLIVLTIFVARSKKPTGYFLLGPTILLCSGHALFYDLGLGVVALLGLFTFEDKNYLRALGGFFAATTIAGTLRFQTAIPLFFLVTLAMYVYIAKLVRQHAAA